MQSFLSIGFGLLSGVVGWMISEFLAKPFRRGIDLIAEARTSTIIYSNVAARAKVPPGRTDGFVAYNEISEKDEQRLQKAEHIFRELGAKMLAFADTDRVAATVRLGTDFRAAGNALIFSPTRLGLMDSSDTMLSRR